MAPPTKSETLERLKKKLKLRQKQLGEKALMNFLQRWKSEPDQQENYLRAVESDFQDASKCALIARNKQGIMEVAKVKMYPDDLCYSLFLKPDWNTDERLNLVPLCEYGFSLKKDKVCMVASHYRLPGAAATSDKKGSDEKTHDKQAQPQSKGSAKNGTADQSKQKAAPHGATPDTEKTGTFASFPTGSTTDTDDTSKQSETTDGTQIPHIGTGIIRKTNCCYGIVTLQILIHNPLVAQLTTAHANCSMTQHGIFCSICEVKNAVRRGLIDRILTDTNTLGLEQSIEAIMPAHVYDAMEDASDFYLSVMASFNECWISQQRSPQVSLDYQRLVTPFDHILAGVLRSELVCLVCGLTKRPTQKFYTLSLAFGNFSMIDSLKSFVKKEMLSQYQCGGCKKSTGGSSTVSIDVAPKTLAFHVKRFVPGFKLCGAMAFPMGFDLRPFMFKKEGSPLWYELYGVIEHTGSSVLTGHYFAYIKEPNGVNWFEMNDRKVKLVTEATVLNCEAYMMLYRMVDTPPPSSAQPKVTPTAPKSPQGHKDSDPFQNGPNKPQPQAQSDSVPKSTKGATKPHDLMASFIGQVESHQWRLAFATCETMVEAVDDTNVKVFLHFAQSQNLWLLQKCCEEFISLQQ